MNYFELHIGDFTEATAHLSLLEDGAYSRLLRKYYATEHPLPSDLKAVQRLIGARSKEEREAVETVLAEFFELQDDGWHQSRCDAEIAAFQEKQVGKEGAKESAKERQRRARERRKSLFDLLRSHGQVPAFSTTTVELEAILSRVTGASPSRDVTPPVTRDDTGTQTPDSKHQSPDAKHHGVAHAPPTPLFAEAPSAPPPAPKPRKPAEPKPEAPTVGTWKAYSQAYGVRYSVEPVRNATVNGQLANVVARLGAEEAPAVAAFYVRNNNSRYVSAGHSVGMLLMDAEKLRTEWATGRQTTATQARLADQTQTNANAFAGMIAAAEERERNAA